MSAQAATAVYLVKYGLPADGCRESTISSSCAATRDGQFTLEEHREMCEDPSLYLDTVARIFKGYLGNRAAYNGFRFSTSDISSGDDDWQCNRNEGYEEGTGNGYGVNPVGCTRSGYDISGVLPDDQRRSGGFSWPPPKENYVYTGLQGAIVAAVILSQANYDVWEWNDKAMLRAYAWLNEVAEFPATDAKAGSNDGWQPYIINSVYGSSFAAKEESIGFNMGFAEWVFGESK